MAVAVLHTYYVMVGRTAVLVHNDDCETFKHLKDLKDVAGADVTARLDVGDQSFFGWNDPGRTGSIPGRWNFSTQHAEGHAFSKALDAKISGGTARLFVFGKDPCRFCQSDISGMARMLNLD